MVRVQQRGGPVGTRSCWGSGHPTGVPRAQCIRHGEAERCLWNNALIAAWIACPAQAATAGTLVPGSQAPGACRDANRSPTPQRDWARQVPRSSHIPRRCPTPSHAPLPCMVACPHLFGGDVQGAAVGELDVHGLEGQGLGRRNAGKQANGVLGAMVLQQQTSQLANALRLAFPGQEQLSIDGLGRPVSGWVTCWRRVHGTRQLRHDPHNVAPIQMRQRRMK